MLEDSQADFIIESVERNSRLILEVPACWLIHFMMTTYPLDPMAAVPTAQPIADMAVEGLAKVGGGATPWLLAIGPLKVRLLMVFPYI